MNFLFDMMSVFTRDNLKLAAVRNTIGEVAEEFACRALGMERLRIDGRKKVCADALWANREVEIKSVGRNRRALIYKWRVEKEKREFGLGYLYVFVLHDCRVTVGTGASVVRHMKDNPPSILIATLADVIKAIGDTPVRKFKLFEGKPDQPFDRKTMHGSQRAGYVEGGWQFDIKKIPVRYETSTSLMWCDKIVNCRLLHT